MSVWSVPDDWPVTLRLDGHAVATFTDERTARWAAKILNADRAIGMVKVEIGTPDSRAAYSVMVRPGDGAQHPIPYNAANSYVRIDPA